MDHLFSGSSNKYLIHLCYEEDQDQKKFTFFVSKVMENLGYMYVVLFSFAADSYWEQMLLKVILLVFMSKKIISCWKLAYKYWSRCLSFD